MPAVSGSFGQGARLSVVRFLPDTTPLQLPSSSAVK